MRLANSTGIATASVATVMFGGMALALNGIAHNEAPRSLAGVGAIMIGLTAIVLLVIHKWVTDTRAERSRLATAQREAQEERALCIAAQSALESERTRMRRDLDAEHAALLERARVEREALDDEFEERRADLICETTEATVKMFYDGKFAPNVRRRGTLIQFPQQQPEDQPHRSRSREHGVVGP